MRVTPEQYERLLKRETRDSRGTFASAPKKSKFGNTKVERNGQTFDSKLEARRYQALELMQKAGEIRDLKPQVEFEIRIGGVLVCAYVADAVYWDCIKNCEVVEDCKSKATRTRLYRLKKKLMAAVRGIEITEVNIA